MLLNLRFGFTTYSTTNFLCLQSGWKFREKALTQGQIMLRFGQLFCQYPHRYYHLIIHSFRSWPQRQNGLPPDYSRGGGGTFLCNISLLSSWATNYFFTSPTILSSTFPRPSHAFCQLQIFLIYQNLTQLRYGRNILIRIYDSCFASFQWSINPNQSSLRNTGFNQRKNINHFMHD